MFYHPVMRKAVCRNLGVEPDIGALREELAVFFFQVAGMEGKHNQGHEENPDYIVERGREKFIIEIGGISKGRSQLRDFLKRPWLLVSASLLFWAFFSLLAFFKQF